MTDFFLTSKSIKYIKYSFIVYSLTCFIYSHIPISIHTVAYTLSDLLNQHRNGGQRE